MKQTIQLFSTPKILIVEDDIQLVDLFSKALNFEGYQTITAHNGEEALKKIQEKETKIDLILLDIIMPKMDGFQVLAKIKNWKRTKNIPVILLTNLGEIEMMEKGLKMGAADYVIKANINFGKISKLLSKHLITKNARFNTHKD